MIEREWQFHMVRPGSLSLPNILLWTIFWQQYHAHVLTAKRPIPNLLDTPATPPFSGLISNIPAPQASCISDTPYIYHCMHHPLFIPLCVISFLSLIYSVSSLYLFHPSPSDYLSNPQGQELLFLLEIYQEKANTQDSCSFEASI